MQDVESPFGASKQLWFMCKAVREIGCCEKRSVSLNLKIDDKGDSFDLVIIVSPSGM